MIELIKIQSELKAPKNQFNSFGKYNYRSCEDILEALKPLLAKHECTLTISDEIKEVGGIIFIEATATIIKGDKSISVKAQAGINPDRKGMDIAQSFGASSSYARKYSLNGLFLIDDTKDPDVTNEHGNGKKEVSKPTTSTPKDTREWLNKGEKLDHAIAYLKGGGKMELIEEKYRLSKEIKESLNAIINQL
jgi:hypothetical protein